MNFNLFHDCKILMTSGVMSSSKVSESEIYSLFFSDIFIEELMNDAKVWSDVFPLL